MNFTVHSLQDLDAVSDYLIQLSPSNTVFCFYGNLGAGKTTLIKLICEKLGVQDSISSPTYPIINEYHCKPNPWAIQKLYHMDLYRFIFRKFLFY